MLRATMLPGDLMLPDLLEENGFLKLLSTAEYDTIPQSNLQVWCHKNARYGLPTIELINWLRQEIGERLAIEIGSGAGDLAFHLGIRATDNRCQELPEVKALYEITKQPVIRYPHYVEKLDALDAISKYHPQVVVASWVTQWIDPNLPVPATGGSVYGVHEDQLLDTGVTYIFVGNDAVHGQKAIMERPHVTLSLPFIRSRAKEPNLDRIYIWPGTRLPGQGRELEFPFPRIGFPGLIKQRRVLPANCR